MLFVRVKVRDDNLFPFQFWRCVYREKGREKKGEREKEKRIYLFWNFHNEKKKV